MLVSEGIFLYHQSVYLYYISYLWYSYLHITPTFSIDNVYLYGSHFVKTKVETVGFKKKSVSYKIYGFIYSYVIPYVKYVEIYVTFKWDLSY